MQERKTENGGHAPHWSDKWELVVGLEVHAQLLTNSKAYSSDPNAYGDRPNTLAGPVTLALPGTLPVANAAVVDHAIKLGLACGCTIAGQMHYARKNYFYPDLPKGYQITQDTTPICTGGAVTITMEDGSEKDIALTRIHMEEDAGKSIHDLDPFNTLIDLNRAGVPLVEVVTEPVIRTSQEAYNYLVELRRLVRYLDICDGNMEEGSLRCDANISLRRKGSSEFGTRTEVKNLNSFRNVQRAIEHEAQRQAAILDQGGSIAMETRNFDAAKGTTTALRSKGMAHDYRYFPEPDLLPLTVTEEKKRAVRATMPPLPRDLRAKYTGQYGLGGYDAGILTDDKGTALYYEEVIRHLGTLEDPKIYKTAANWIMGDVRSWVNEKGLAIDDLPIAPGRLAGLVTLVHQGKISHTLASQKLFPLLLQEEGSAETLAEKHGLLTDAGEDEVRRAMQEAMDRYPDKVEAYRGGNKGLLGLFMGELMKATKGKADPRSANAVAREMLEGK